MLDQLFTGESFKLLEQNIYDTRFLGHDVLVIISDNKKYLRLNDICKKYGKEMNKVVDKMYYKKIMEDYRNDTKKSAVIKIASGSPNDRRGNYYVEDVIFQIATHISDKFSNLIKDKLQ
jgi:UDP-glucose 6-dehydrogenase